MTTRKTLKDFLTQRVGSTQDRLTYNVKSEDGLSNQYTGKDLGKDTGSDKELLDLENEQIGILGDYLSYLIELSSNKYKVSPGNEQAAPSNRGDSLVIADEQGAENIFVRQGTADAGNLNQYSNSGKMDTSSLKVSDVFDKTGKESDSHETLKDIPGNTLNKTDKIRVNPAGVDNDVIKLSNNLLRNNRFANLANKPSFLDNQTSTREFEQGSESAGTISAQDSMGDYNQNFQKVTLDDLKKLGASLLLKSSGFDVSLSPSTSATVEDLESDILNNKVNSKHISDTGYMKSDIELLRARNASGFPADVAGNSIKAGDGDFLSVDPEAKNAKSFGTSYNSVMQHGFGNTDVLKFQTAAAVVAMVKSTSDLFNTVASITNTKKNNPLKPKSDSVIQKEPKYNGPGPFLYGQHKPSLSDKLDYIKKELLTQTIYPYTDAVEMGLKVMFGSKNPKISDVQKYDHVSQAPAFWFAVANTVLKSANEINESLLLLNAGNGFKAKNIGGVVRELQRTKIINFMNVAATMGDVFLQSTGGRRSFSALRNLKRIYDVDALPDGGGTRVGKIRSANGLSPLNLAYRQSDAQSLYLLPRNVIRAVTRLGNLSVGTNPAKGMLGSELIKDTYLDRTMDGDFPRIPEDVVKRLEDKLDAEYVPFYFQDLRTNEVVSFHAFLNSLTDQITPTFNAQSGYGRLDDVQTYSSTKRTVSVGFTVFATSKEDFNNMWYKINKFVTLLYPQWTPGSQIETEDGKFFKQPFSQVIGASPIVRMRVGDVIKSNYSKFNLQRVFGAGDKDTNFLGNSDTLGGLQAGFLSAFLGDNFSDTASFRDLTLELTTEIFYALYGTPLQYIKRNSNRPLLSTIARNAVDTLFGHVNPLGTGIILNQLLDPDQSIVQPQGSVTLSSLSERLSLAARDRAVTSNNAGFAPLSTHFLKPSMGRKYLCSDNGKEYVIDRPVRILIKGIRSRRDTLNITNRDASSTSPNFKSFRNDFNSERTVYEVKVIDLTAPKDLFFKDFFIYHSDVLPNPNTLFNTFVMPAFADWRSIADALVTPIVQEASLAAGIGAEGAGAVRDAIFGKLVEQNDFFKNENNPIVRAFDTTKGRGLAGTLGGINFDWLEFPWETDWNSRAPKGVKISLTFNVIHDIPPGLDSSGYNRAPLYNVGDIMRHVAGDPHDDNGAGSEFSYKNEGRKTFRSDKGE